jgi:hypothetical protein
MVAWWIVAAALIQPLRRPTSVGSSPGGVQRGLDRRAPAEGDADLRRRTRYATVIARKESVP